MFEKLGINTSSFPTFHVLMDYAEDGYSAIFYEGIFASLAKLLFSWWYSIFLMGLLYTSKKLCDKFTWEFSDRKTFSSPEKPIFLQLTTKRTTILFVPWNIYRKLREQISISFQSLSWISFLLLHQYGFWTFLLV